MRKHTLLLSSVFVTCLLATGGACGPGSDGGTTPAEEGPACDLLGNCDNGLECCNGTCVDLEGSPTNCGACGVDCAFDDGYCASGGSCAELTWTGLCQNTNVLALRDGVAADDAATDQMRDAVAAACGVDAQTGASGDSSLVDSDGRPRVGVGTTIVTGGGGFFQPTVDYIEETGRTPVYAEQTDGGATSRLVRRSNADVIASVPSDVTGEGSDTFVVYLVDDPAGGALMLAAYGFTGHGTRAGAWWVENVLLADPSAHTSSWYAVEWTNSGQSSGPDSGDDFQVIASD